MSIKRYRQYRVYDFLGKHLSLRRYDNVVNPVVNMRYISYGRQEAGEQWRSSTADWPLRNSRPIRIPSAISGEAALALSERVSEIVRAKGSRNPDGLPNVHLIPRPTELLGEVLDELLDGPLGEHVCALYGSHFRVEWLDCYRTYPGGEGKAWLWHTDNVPPFLVKALVYLTDVTEDSGPTLVLTPEKTKSLKSVNYLPLREHQRPGRIEDNGLVHIEPADVQCVCASPGDAILFNTNHYHKAQPPKVAFRDAISIQILPSQLPWRQSLRNGLRASLDDAGGFPLDPFRR